VKKGGRGGGGAGRRADRPAKKRAGKRAGGRAVGAGRKEGGQADRRTGKPSRARESADARAHRALEILARLKAAYPDATCALEHQSPYQLLVATILSAQCTDVRVNMVTPAFFEAWPAPADLARARSDSVEQAVMSTGFFRNKARNLIAMARALMAEHGGEVPRTMAQLHALPGVGRKTANVVLGNAYGINEGVTVDTHVTRLAGLLGLTRQTDPVKIEQELMGLIPRNDWTLISHLLINHGRAVCIARRPKCEGCVLNDLCPSAKVPRAGTQPVVPAKA
jgi:endonuclease-3